MQEIIRWKALDEIYKICMLLHRSDLNISEDFRQTFSNFSEKNCEIRLFLFFSVIFAQNLMKFDRNFANVLGNVEILNFLNFLNFLAKHF